MANITHTLKIIGVAACISISAPVFAESAPVFDASDAMQADNEQNQDYPMPPPPESGGFVPSNQVENHPSGRPSTDQRLSQMEQQLNNLQNTDAGSKVDSLQDQVRALRNTVEELTHQISQMKDQQRMLAKDVDKRLQQTVAMKATAALSPDVKSPPDQKLARKPAQSAPEDVNQPNVAEEQAIYQTAYNLIKTKKYNEAVKALQGMLVKYPSGQFASNAHYWLGELYGLMGKNNLAMLEFNTVVKTYPDSPRVADAQLKIGLILAAQFKWPEAKNAFKQVVTRYPGTASSRLAAEQIKQIKQAGH